MPESTTIPSHGSVPQEALSPVLQRLFELLTPYLEANHAPDIQVTRHQTPRAIHDALPVQLGEAAGSFEELFVALEAYMTHSVRTGHHQFYNQLWAGFSLPGFLGDVVAAATRTSMYTFEMSPVATLMEQELMRKMASYLGWDRGEGTFVTGGSNANLVALLMARNARFPESKQHGMMGVKAPPVIFVSEEAHYSFLKACNATGIGQSNLWYIRTDSQGRLDPAHLAERVQEAKAQGKTPLLACATSGTTVKGAYDPIDAMADVCEPAGIWLHIDGSWGGSAILSPKHRHLLAGCERAHTMAWNPHKQMSVSLPTSVLLTREPGQLLSSNCSGDNDYLFREEAANLDLGEMSLQCGRQVHSLKLWLAWKYFGDDGYAYRLDRLFENAAYAAKRLEDHPHFELQAPLQSTNVCFRYVPAFTTDLNAFNDRMRKLLLEDGRTMINVAYLGPQKDFTIRWVFANPEVSFADIDQTIRYLEEAAAKTEAELNPALATQS